jgi:urease accessory protein
MLRFVELVPSTLAGSATLELALSHDQRRRSRLRIQLADGRAAGLFLPRGTALSEGSLLRAEDGTIARVTAAPEYVSVVESPDMHLLMRAAYHLGNRHVPLQVEREHLMYPHDHVLDGMCRELGLSVSERLLPFEPERGGYAGEHRHAHGGDRAPFAPGHHGHG